MTLPHNEIESGVFLSAGEPKEVLLVRRDNSFPAQGYELVSLVHVETLICFSDDFIVLTLIQL